MYIIKNAFVSILRNKGRNVLIGIIITVIAIACTIALAIRNTANMTVEEYTNANDIIGSISFNREALMTNFKGGEDATKDNIEAFNKIESLTLDKINDYGTSEYLKGYYYIYSTSLNSDTLTKASDTFEYEVEDKTTSTTTKKSNSSNRPGMENGGMTEKNTTITITKRTEKMGINNALTGDFEIDGYSSYDAMTKFSDGTYKIIDGQMIGNFDDFECVINLELAKLNEISIGDTITLKNSTTKDTYDFTVVGIYEDTEEQENTQNMYSKSVNTIITGSGVVSKLVSDDETLTTNITPSFIIKDEDSIEKFSEELTTKGLNEYYTLTTNLEDITNATKSLKNVKTFATTFLIITLVISSVVLLIINMINIRERKYEIGVFRTIGLSKFKLTMQFLLELLMVSLVSLTLGAIIGSASAKSVGNYLLQNQIKETEATKEQESNNFGRGDIERKFNTGVQVKQIDSMNTVVNYVVILELLGIGLILTLISGLSSMISIERFSPLTILKERS